VAVGGKHPFCSPNGSNITLISVFGFSSPRDVTSIGQFSSESNEEVLSAGTHEPPA